MAGHENETARGGGPLSKQHGYCCERQNHSAEKANHEHPVIEIEAMHRGPRQKNRAKGAEGENLRAEVGESRQEPEP